VKKKDFISLLDYTSEELHSLIDLADQIKANPKEYSNSLSGKILGMIFQKNSTRTRISFQAGIYQLGGTGFFFGANDLQLSRGETIYDTANVLSRYMDGIMIRTFAYSDVQELAKHATIPVINGLTDYNHPCQVMADIMTIREKLGKNTKGMKLTYVGDSNNMTLSLIYMCANFKMNMTVVSPMKYQLKEREDVKKIALKIYPDMKLDFVEDAASGVKGSNVIYTDTWTSMGQEKEREQRLKDLNGYMVDSKMMKLADKNAIFMHCLPAHRGEEVATEVIDGHQSVVFDEAENRMHAQKAIMYHLMRD